MKLVLIALVGTLVSSSAFAMCGKYYSTAEKAGERVNELLRIEQAQAARSEQNGQTYNSLEIKVLVSPKNITTPCFNGNDQYRIEIEGTIQNEGDVDGSIG